MSWQSIRCYGAIAGLGIWGVACQPNAAPPSGADEASSPTETQTVDSTSPATESPPDAHGMPNDTAESLPETANNSAAATPEQSCSAGAYVVDSDPAGLNVRGGPGSDFAIQDTLPTGVPVEVSIVGATGEWFLVNEAWSGEQPELERPGWVYGPLLGVSTTSLNINEPNAPTSLYAEPDGSAAIAATLPKGSKVTLLGCSGNWLQVEAPTATGWLAVGEQCSNPVSTCP